MRYAGLVVVAAALMAPPAEAATTSCTLAGPAGTFRAFELELAASSSTLALTLDAPYSRTGLSHGSWHLAAGVIVVDLDTLRVVAYRVSDDGISPRRALVVVPGQDPVSADTPGPGVPIRRTGELPAPGLAAGRYGVVGFGTDGDGADPMAAPPWWSATLQVDGTHSCLSTADGTVFDHDATDFRAGTTLAAGSALYEEAAQFEAAFERELVVGLIDANGGPGGAASIAYRHPSSSGTVTNDIVAFASRGGAFTWVADAAAAVSSLDVAGVAIDLQQKGGSA